MVTGNEIDLLVELVKHYSPTGQEGQAVSFLVGRMQAAGFEAWIDPAGNAVGSRGKGPREILFLGHIDTVPGEIPIVIEGDMLYGRGSVDAKGPLACFVSAVARCPVPPGWKLTVIAAVGEEGDSRGAKYLLDRTPPEMLVIGEPSGWDRITLGYKGSVSLHFAVERSETHTASGEETASEAGVKFWNDLVASTSEYNSCASGVFDQLTPTLKSFVSSFDGFCQKAELTVGLRLPERLAEDNLKTMLARFAGQGRLDLGECLPAYRSTKNTPLVRALLAGIRAAGGQPGFTLKTGASDMNLVAPRWSCPAVAYGPGDSHLDHTPGEHLAISEYLRGIQVLQNAVQQLLSTSRLH